MTPQEAQGKSIARCVHEIDEQAHTIRRLEAQIDEQAATIRRLEAKVAQARSLHFEYRPAAFDDYDCCGHCNALGNTYVEWPCPTVRALDGDALQLSNDDLAWGDWVADA